MADAKTEKALARITEEARESFAADLVSVTLYGSAVSADFVAGRSDLNLAIVVESVSIGHLQRLGERLPGWHRLGAAAPLLIDREFLARARDVYPMEMLDIRAERRVLFGEDVFAGVEVDFRHLRYQLEQEARSKLLRLRVMFAESGGKKQAVRELMQDSVKAFVVLMRALLRFRGVEAHAASLEALDQFEEAFVLPLPAVREVLHVVFATGEWERDASETFADYHSDIEKLVGLIDRAVHVEA